MPGEPRLGEPHLPARPLPGYASTSPCSLGCTGPHLGAHARLPRSPRGDRDGPQLLAGGAAGPPGLRPEPGRHRHAEDAPQHLLQRVGAGRFGLGAPVPGRLCTLPTAPARRPAPGRPGLGPGGVPEMQTPLPAEPLGGSPLGFPMCQMGSPPSPARQSRGSGGPCDRPGLQASSGEGGGPGQAPPCLAAGAPCPDRYRQVCGGDSPSPGRSRESSPVAPPLPPRPEVSAHTSAPDPP